MANADDSVQTSRDTRDPVNATSRPSTLDKESLLKWVKREFRDDASHSAVWRREAKEFFDFIAGRMWTPEEKAQLNAQLRPEVVFNRALTIIKAIAGFEINSRHEIQFLPRNTAQTAVNELLTGASKWMGQDCDAEDEESEAFGHTLICGMGWTESRMDYELERQGKYIEEWIDPLEMYWDRKAKKKNLVDGRRRYRLRKMSLGDGMDMFPGYDAQQLDARWAVGMDPQEETKTLEEKRRREENASAASDEATEVHILHAQWWEREPYWLVADPVTNKKMELSVAEYNELQRRLKVIAKLAATGGAAPPPPMKSVKLTRRRFKQCFVGTEILIHKDDDADGDEGMPAPDRDEKSNGVENAPNPDAFSWHCITGEPDFNKGTWFGIVQVMRDPQKWSNKFFSQIMHILNSQAKGGIFVEKDFAEDQRKFEEDYAKPTSVTVVKKGALSGQAGGVGPKWAAKPTAEFPQGFQTLLEFSISSIRDVTGINLELLGQRDMNQPGILESMRKQAGMTVLATMFDSLRRFRKIVGRTRLYFIQNFISDGRIIRITGRDGAQAIPLLRDQCLGDYDTVVDDTPTSPNQKEANWAIIAPMLPMFKEQLAAMPELLVAILEYSPLPSRLVELLKALISKPNPDQEQAKKLAIAALIAKIDKDQSTAEMQNAKAGSSQATAVYDLAMAHHMLTKEGLSAEVPNPLEDAHTVAKIDTEQAKAENLRAQTAGEHASTHATHVGAAVEALMPIPHHRDAFPKKPAKGA